MIVHSRARQVSKQEAEAHIRRQKVCVRGGVVWRSTWGIPCAYIYMRRDNLCDTQLIPLLGLCVRARRDRLCRFRLCLSCIVPL